MPKVKEKPDSFLRRMVFDKPEIFTSDGSVLFCKICDTNVRAGQKSDVDQHCGGKTHKKNIDRKNKGNHTTTQTLLTLPPPAENQKASEFAMDLTRTFLEANIALHKIANEGVKRFIEKYTQFAAPSEWTLRQKCLPNLFDENIDRMKKIANGKYIWVSLDETTDVEQRYVANLVFGVLGEPNSSYLFASKVLDATNNHTIAAFFDESMNELSKIEKKFLVSSNLISECLKNSRCRQKKSFIGRHRRSTLYGLCNEFFNGTLSKNDSCNVSRAWFTSCDRFHPKTI